MGFYLLWEAFFSQGLTCLSSAPAPHFLFAGQHPPNFHLLVSSWICRSSGNPLSGVRCDSRHSPSGSPSLLGCQLPRYLHRPSSSQVAGYRSSPPGPGSMASAQPLPPLDPGRSIPACTGKTGGPASLESLLHNGGKKAKVSSAAMGITGREGNLILCTVHVSYPLI